MLSTRRALSIKAHQLRQTQNLSHSHHSIGRIRSILTGSKRRITRTSLLMQNSKGARNVHVIIHRLSKSLRNLTTRLQHILSSGKERLNTLNSGCRLLQRRRTVIQHRTIMRATQVVANHQRTSHLKHLRRRNRITDRLRHLLTLIGDHAVMHPEIREIITGSSRLRQLILMVRETQIQAATMNIETRPQVLTSHRRALQMPARTAATPRRLPRSS